jgi:hypothetical protein
MMARETKATRSEAAKGALRETTLVLLPALIAAPTIIWFALRSSAPKIVTIPNLAMFVGFIGVYLGIAMFGLIYFRIRGEPTRVEVEKRDRAVAAALLAKYPDLKDS